MMKVMFDLLCHDRDRPNPRGPDGMALVALGAAVVVAGLSACGPAEPAKPIPRPAEMSQVDPWVAHEMDKAQAAVTAAPDNAARWGTLGDFYFAHDYFGLAVSAYSASLLLVPEQPKVSYMLAVALRADGDSEVAMEEIRQTLELDAKTPHLRWRAAEWLIDSGDLEGAAELAEEAVVLAPADRNSIRMLARVRLEQGRPEEAIEILEPLLAGNPTDSEVRSLRGRALRAAGRIDEAARDMLLGGQVQPTWFDDWINEVLVRRTDRAWWIRRIQRLANGGDPAAARPFLQELRRWHPDAREVDFTEGVVLVSEGRLEEALSRFEALVEKDPDWAAARIRAATIRLARADASADPIAAMDDREAAATMLEAALANEPGNDDALGLLALVHERQGRPADAVPLRRRLVEKVPGNRGNRLRLAQALLVSGEPAAAVEVLDLAVADFGSEGPPAMVVRVDALARDSRLPEAARALDALRARAPRHPALGRLGSLVEGEGRP